VRAPLTSSAVLTRPHGTPPRRTEVLALEAAVVPNIITDVVNKKKKVEEAWKELRVDASQLPQHYLMLSKFRLTCKYLHMNIAC